MSSHKDSGEEKKSKPIHEGHRERVKERFLREGLDGFTEIQVLELMLFYAKPQGDTNELAHRLLSAFDNSLCRVMDAPVEKLCKVKGVKLHTATVIKLFRDIGRTYQIFKAKEVKILPTIDDCGNYLLPYFSGKRNEVVYLLCLDAKRTVLDCIEVDEGSVNYASVPVRRVVETALAVGASSVVLAHNHPSGLAVPSMEDVQTTRRLAAALSAVEITLVDHIVVAEDDYVSMIQSGYRFDDCLIY